MTAEDLGFGLLFLVIFGHLFAFSAGLLFDKAARSLYGFGFTSNNIAFWVSVLLSVALFTMFYTIVLARLIIFLDTFIAFDDDVVSAVSILNVFVAFFLACWTVLFFGRFGREHSIKTEAEKND